MTADQHGAETTDDSPAAEGAPAGASAGADDLQQQFVAARERLSAARATLDQYASNAGQPVDTVPEEPAFAVNPAYDDARREYDDANAEFVRLEDQLKPRWADEASQPVEQATE